MAITGSASVVLRLLSDTRGARAGIKGVAGDLRKLGTGFVQTGGMMTRNFTLPIIGGMAAAYIKTGQFRKAMDEVSAKAEGAWDKQGESFQRLREKVKALGRDTNYTAIQVAEGAAYMAQAGMDSTEIFQGLEHVLYMAGAGNMEFSRAA